MVPRSSATVRRCGASSAKSLGGSAVRNRLSLAGSGRRAAETVPYGIAVAPETVPPTVSARMPAIDEPQGSRLSVGKLNLYSFKSSTANVCQQTFLRRLADHQ